MGASPNYFDDHYARFRAVSSSGDEWNHYVSNINGTRPVITLIPSTEIDEGEGTYESPYVIGDKIIR